MFGYISTALVAAIMLMASNILVHAETAAQTLKVSAQCTTEGTELSGVRHGCQSEVQSVTAPKGYVLARDTLSGGETGANGSEPNPCRISFSDSVEVIPGVPQPRTVHLQAHARSPKGHGSGRGWATCVYSIRMVPLI